MKNKVEEIENLIKKLGVTFNDKALLQAAVTHSSYANQKKDVEYNERLEFLGDSVLQLSVSDYLFKNYNDKSEGELTKIRALIVCENSLHNLAKSWDLGRYIKMSKGEELTGGRTRPSILADCVEAIIAAIYIDGGFEDAKDFVIKFLKETIEKAVKNEIILDYKTNLQEVLQKKGDISICYNLVKLEGPPHRRKFYTEVVVDNKVKGQGSGYSKKEAEQNAAKEALTELGGNDD